jgi:hypothetical protein
VSLLCTASRKLTLFSFGILSNRGGKGGKKIYCWSFLAACR